MNAAPDIEPVTALKARTSELIRRVGETGNPIVISVNGRPGAILQNFDAWRRQRATLLLLKAVVRGDQDYRAGRTISHDQARARLRGKLAEVSEGE